MKPFILLSLALTAALATPLPPSETTDLRGPGAPDNSVDYADESFVTPDQLAPDTMSKREPLPESGKKKKKKKLPGKPKPGEKNPHGNLPSMDQTGRVEYPDGTILYADGHVRYPDGHMTYPDGSTREWTVEDQKAELEQYDPKNQAPKNPKSE